MNLSFWLQSLQNEEVANSGPGWLAVIGDRKAVVAHACNLGFAEETVALIEFEDGTYEVGIGESLRPYIQIYLGDSGRAAVDAFFRAVQERVSWGL